MESLQKLREIGLLEARAPRYTSYPPANHFTGRVGPDQTAAWLEALPSGARVSLYLHIPYCRRLCWFCACRTQGTATDRPLAPYMDHLMHEMALVDRHLRKDVILSHIHLGGGTPTILPPVMIRDLGKKLAAFRPWAEDLQFAVEIDPTEVDAPRIEALREIGMTRASIGVQDFDPMVQESIGRIQSYEKTAEVVGWLRSAGVDSLNMDILYGLPHQTTARMSRTVEKVLGLVPDRVALFGYAHVPWMAKRQVLIPSEALPEAEQRLGLFDTARKLFLQAGYDEIGIDHYARPGDGMASAARAGTLKRNFQGYTGDIADALIGLGASAISRYPQGYAQNESVSSRYAKAAMDGHLATARGHAMDEDDLVRARMIEEIMCQFEVDLGRLAEDFELSAEDIDILTSPALEAYPDHVRIIDSVLSISKDARLLARLVASTFDGYAQAGGRYSRAV